MGVLTMIIVLASRFALKMTQEFFLDNVDLKKKRVGYPSVMSFEDWSASGSLGICDLFHKVSVESRAESCEWQAAFWFASVYCFGGWERVVGVE
jgi:hypothetical protein